MYHVYYVHRRLHFFISLVLS